MKFCLWKITSLQLKETSCFSLSNYRMTAVYLQHTRFGILGFATSVVSVFKSVHRHGFEGIGTNSWLNSSLFIASLLLLPKHTKLRGQVMRTFQIPQARSWELTEKRAEFTSF